MRLRQPSIADAPALGRVHVGAWQEGYKNGLMPSEYLDGLSVAERTEMWEGGLSRDLRPRSARIVSVDDDDVVTGFILVGPAEGDPDSTVGEVFALNVDPDFWGQGHGGALLTAGVEALRGEAFEQAVLWVTPTANGPGASTSITVGSRTESSAPSRCSARRSPRRGIASPLFAPEAVFAHGMRAVARIPCAKTGRWFRGRGH